MKDTDAGSGGAGAKRQRRTPRLKCWTGNLDGSRTGLVCATSKKRAAKAAGTSLHDFNNDWFEEPGNILPAAAEPETLFTRPYGSNVEWTRGRCDVPSRRSWPTR